jgi:flagellar protein FlaG
MKSRQPVLVAFRDDQRNEMTAVSSTAMSSSMTPVAAPLAPRNADAVVAAVAEVKGNVPASDTAVSKTEQNSSSAASSKASAKTLSKAELTGQVHELQLKMDKLNPALAFVVDQSSGRALIQLTDRNTKEVIKQFPTEAAIQISKALDRFEKGMLISRTA